MPRAGGKSFEWLTHVFEGEYRVMEAWKERGGGYAPTVSEKGWEGFATHSAAARKNFTRAWELRPDLPLAPSRMIYVAMGDSGAEEMRVWFDRTIAAQVDYPKAWSDMRWGLRPRWHGSLEAMLALGKTAVDTGRFDTDVPRKFLDLVSDLESELKVPFGQHLYGRPDIWPECVRMYEGYIAAPSQEKTAGGLAERVCVGRLSRRKVRRGPRTIGGGELAAVALQSFGLGHRPLIDVAGGGGSHGFRRGKDFGG
jgi:hypothetical protein